MFITDDFIFIELHKTGSSHIVKLLSALFEGEQHGKHIPAGPAHFAQEKIFLGSVRNPWDWYLSLWAYGCDRKGSFYESVAGAIPRIRGHGWSRDVRQAFRSLLHEPFRKAEAWRDSYSDVNNPEKFRNWLHMVHDRAYWSDYGEGYSFSPVRKNSGIFTHRYINLFCRNSHRIHRQKDVTVDNLIEFEQQHCYIDFFIHNETLEDDLIGIMQRCGRELTRNKRESIRKKQKTNTSSRANDAGYYYDRDTIQLVREREQLIIRKFGYAPPCNHH